MPRQVLQRPRPRSRGSGLPSPVLKFAWQRMQTYILELDIIGRTPGSALGRAAVYSACVWRSLGPLVVSGALGVRRVVIAGGGRDAEPGFVAKCLLSPKYKPIALRTVMDAGGERVGAFSDEH